MIVCRFIDSEMIETKFESISLDRNTAQEIMYCYNKIKRSYSHKCLSKLVTYVICICIIGLFAF